ncbi:hypothetical protein [Streptomyces sp. H39-S7]|uniref:hypothetical protein n=1 Tax=Streptomyces sp. H39-S7 TaxID=3004357 RepID=UPI0022AF8634|nr:hypothetical protein [Streptomyces sp. H39-S7]MCZ4122872.1 hypothetical protein [Streptomyces sp. H39-S7]
MHRDQLRAVAAAVFATALLILSALTAQPSNAAAPEPVAALNPAAVRAPAADKPAVALSPQEAKPGTEITVTGRGWKPTTLLTLLVCGQNAIGGTNSCSNASGRAVTTDAKGGFTRKLPAAAPPKPCPCVVHVATVTGDSVTVDAPFTVTGHPVAELPQQSGAGRLAVLTARLQGGGGLLTWFGSPPQRHLVFTVGNLGSGPVKDPVFQVGVSHGVFAPQWEEQRWSGSVAPGMKQQIKLPVELTSGAHGDYRVQLRYGGKVLVTEPWDVGRPWGVTLFWILLCVVVPAAVFRIGMAVVDRARPRLPGTIYASGRRRKAPWRPAALLHLPPPRRSAPPQSSGPQPNGARPAGSRPPDDTGTLPWFAQGTLPAPAAAEEPPPTSAPSTDRPSSKGNT